MVIRSCAQAQLFQKKTSWLCRHYREPSSKHWYMQLLWKRKNWDPAGTWIWIPWMPVRCCYHWTTDSCRQHGIHELLKTSTHATWELSCVYELAHGFIISSPGWKNWNNGLQFFSRDCSESAPGPGRWPTTLQSQTGFLSVRIFYNVQCVIAGTYIQV